jgi:hypothetical protein
MLPGTVWGFLTALLIVLVGAYLLSPDSFNNWRPETGTPWSMTLLCTGGSAAFNNWRPQESETPWSRLLCAGGSGAHCRGQEDRSEHTPGLAVTIDRRNGRVNIYSEGQGSANGDIIQDEDSHLLFGDKCTDRAAADANKGTSADAGKGADANKGVSADAGKGADANKGTSMCMVASGEINRLTGVASIAITDSSGNTVVEWNKINCKRKSRNF